MGSGGNLGSIIPLAICDHASAKGLACCLLRVVSNMCVLVLFDICSYSFLFPFQSVTDTTSMTNSI